MADSLLPRSLATPITLLLENVLILANSSEYSKTMLDNPLLAL